MPDITMCAGSGRLGGNPNNSLMTCPRKNQCYRATATPSPHRQSYFIGLPVQYEDELANCSMFWDNSKKIRYLPRSKLNGE